MPLVDTCPTRPPPPTHTHPCFVGADRHDIPKILHDRTATSIVAGAYADVDVGSGPTGYSKSRLAKSALGRRLVPEIELTSLTNILGGGVDAEGYASGYNKK